MPKLDDFLNKEKTYIPGKIYRLDFSIGSEPVEIKEVQEPINFSEDVYYNQFKDFLENFSLLELIRVNNLPPKQVLKRRINEVARYVNGSNNEKVIENKYTITNYLNNYIFEQIMKLMNDPKINTINLMQFLSLNLYMKDLGPLRNLQRYLLRAKKALKSSGFLTKQVQTEIKKYYGEVWNQFISGVEDKYFSDSKKGLLSGGSTPQGAGDKGFTRLAAFSEDLSKIEVKEASDEKEFCFTISQILELADTQEYIDTLESYLKKNKKFIENNIDKIKKFVEDNPLQDDYKLTDYFIATLDSFDFSKLYEYIKEENEFELNNFSLSELVLGVENFTATGSSMILPKNYEKESDISGYLKPIRNIWYYFKGIELDNGKFQLSIFEFKYPEQDYKLLGLTEDEKNKLFKDDKYRVSEKLFDNKLDLMNEIIKQSDLLASQNYLQFSEDYKLNIIKDTDSMFLGSKLYNKYLILFFGLKLKNSFWQLYIYKVSDLKYITGNSKDFTEVLSTAPDYSFKLSDKNEIKEFCNNYEIIN